MILLGAAGVALSLAAAQTPPDAARTTSANTPTSAAPPPPHGATRGAKTPAARGKTDAPDAAVLEYLGEFDDAGDGLDALGLAGDDAANPNAKPADGGRR